MDDEYNIDLYDDVDYCNGGEFVNPDLAGECLHENFFRNYQNLTERNEFQNRQNINFCCADHGYSFDDYCEV